ncbi:2-amino-4-hydroxy-6-hydroxymethyldihydropteridine diphosphokinase [Paenibacillus filicis]|uniref:2-amino-4-hydroxy-6-hydroxymethyldihydropteridine diphosphokinase n=1 Tax=Paenibacillus gyeongsangnamensis TaxID=3388067 RepID=A0ABT4QLK7_9BACL|nr:2-amino-4-hydroxy-6-hydroxymethyldihydropteridine diphosphokinase [Paenibacillus filicis]MCZ8517600.1 2-amino-4-hydroxy-6-hydroxymethyldihydropteridine diphosphokinase [Paenibacillus filicis]
MRQIAYVGLGSNLGDRERYLDEAVMLLEQHHGVRVTGKSSIYETDPVGFVDQGPFLNRVIEVETALSPEALFEVMLAAEQSLGRKREVRWGPRTIDLDMLLFDEREQDRPDLILPHPRMLERAFVLVPLIEVMSGRQPGKAEALKRQLDRAEGKEGVTLWKRTTL